MSTPPLRPDQRRLIETVREFVAQAVIPVAAELDRRPNPEDCFSWAIVEAASRAGIRTLTLRTEFGGSIGRIHDKMGERLANNAELIFRDCRVRDDQVLGRVNGGFEILVRFFPASNAYAAASGLGVAQAAYEPKSSRRARPGGS